MLLIIHERDMTDMSDPLSSRTSVVTCSSKRQDMTGLLNGYLGLCQYLCSIYRSTSWVAEEILGLLDGYNSSMHPIDENPLWRSSMKLVGDHLRMVVEHFEMVAVKNWQLAVVFLCLDLDWDRHGRELSFFVVD